MVCDPIIHAYCLYLSSPCSHVHCWADVYKLLVHAHYPYATVHDYCPYLWPLCFHVHCGGDDYILLVHVTVYVSLMPTVTLLSHLFCAYSYYLSHFHSYFIVSHMLVLLSSLLLLPLTCPRILYCLSHACFTFMSTVVDSHMLKPLVCLLLYNWRTNKGCFEWSRFLEHAFLKRSKENFPIRWEGRTGNLLSLKYFILLHLPLIYFMMWRLK